MAEPTVEPTAEPTAEPTGTPDFDLSAHLAPLATALTGLNLGIDEKVYGQAARLNITSTLLDSPAMTALLATHRNAVIDDVLGHARHVITQYLSTAEKWRYDRVCWAFAIMLGEIPADTPEPLSPADEDYLSRQAAQQAARQSTDQDLEGTASDE